MQAGVGLLVTDVMPIFMIIALDIFITMRFSVEQLIEKRIIMRMSRYDHVYRNHVRDK